MNVDWARVPTIVVVSSHQSSRERVGRIYCCTLAPEYDKLAAEGHGAEIEGAGGAHFPLVDDHAHLHLKASRASGRRGLHYELDSIEEPRTCITEIGSRVAAR